MKLVTYDKDGTLKLGAVVGDRVADLVALAGGEHRAPEFLSARHFLAAGDAAADRAQRLLIEGGAGHDRECWLPLERLALKAPVTDPGKIMALAGNYREHLREGGHAIVARPQQIPDVFIKPVTCVAGPDEPIIQPGHICERVDYEAELGVVIGRRCKNVRVEEALNVVAGYLNFNDISGRALNLGVGIPPELAARRKFFDWLAGKWFDTFAPMGPYLVLKDEVPDPQSLEITLRVNGEVRQSSSTANMIFDVAETVAFVSRFVTLEPGDIIATGTPEGVGSSTGRFLQVGDVVEMQIGCLGVLRNRVTAPASALATVG